ncbi:Trans-cinnamate:CoA ligase, peroxisomal [Linum grandiflorum]
MDQLPKCDANYVALTPITFLKRASQVYSNRTSIIYNGTHFTWGHTYSRCRHLASSLKRSMNVAKNDVVSVLAPNVPALYEMHFAVPMAGAVLNAINTRLDASTIATILSHSGAKIFFVDFDFISVAKKAIELLAGTTTAVPVVVVIDDMDSPTGVRFGDHQLEYEQLVSDGNRDFVPEEIEDEWDPISLNYTSGTTSSPKGVVYSHRGAYLSTLSLIMGWEMGTSPVYLWSLPMFHCNGWTFTWGIAARGGTNVCIRETTAVEIYRNIAIHKVTHMCAAPVIFTVILAAKPHEVFPLDSPVNVLTGGAPPPAALLEKIEPMGFHVTHAYGLTEATGPALVCEWQSKWDRLPRVDRGKLKARQGISILGLADVDVKDLKTMKSVPRDGHVMGEIVLRGSSIMKGYFKDPKTTSEAFVHGGQWFATGDVGVVHPDGYVEIKDRSKDVIISGGENISSVEVESVLCRHPKISEAAVVAMPHPVWGESPCAFVAVSAQAEEGEILAFCKENMPRFMVPKKVVFMSEVPRNGNGKFMKVELREMARSLAAAEKVADGVNGEVAREQILAMSRI